MTTSTAIAGHQARAGYRTHARHQASAGSRGSAGHQGSVGYQGRALVVISGDDVYEDLFIASIKIQEVLTRQGFATREVFGTSALATSEQADLVVLYTALGFFPPNRQAALAAAVAAGTGLIVIHSGNVFPQLSGGSLDPEYHRICDLIGSRFIGHGPAPHQSRFRVALDPGHAVTSGLREFEITHEHYHLETAPGVKVLAWRAVPDTQAPGGREPICHIRTAGRGRVCYLQLGHDMRAWDEPGVRQLLGQAAQWARRAVPASVTELPAPAAKRAVPATEPPAPATDPAGAGHLDTGREPR